MSGPYRTAGRAVTDADRVKPEPPPPRTMVDLMIEACTEARRRQHRGWLRYRLSYAAYRDIEAGLIDRADYSPPWTPPPSDTPAPEGCEYRCSFRGFPVYVDPQMVAGWTVELEPRRAW